MSWNVLNVSTNIIMISSLTSGSCISLSVESCPFCLVQKMHVIFFLLFIQLSFQISEFLSAGVYSMKFKCNHK